MAFDSGPLARQLEAAQAKFECLSCGSRNIRFADTRYALIELQSDDHLAVSEDWGLAVL